MNKRGDILLYNALELVGAVLATFLIINTAVSWTSGEAINRFYYSKDLALLVDTLMIPDGTVHLAYQDNLSLYTIEFSPFSVLVAKDRLDPFAPEFPYASNSKYILSTVLQNPEKIFFAKTSRSMVVTTEEKKYEREVLYEDIEIKDEKSVVISPRTEGLSGFAEEKIYPLLRDLSKEAQLSFSKEQDSTKQTQLIIGETKREEAINIIYRKSSNTELMKKRTKLTNIIYKKLLSKNPNTYIMPSNLKLQESNNVIVLIELGQRWKEDPSAIMDPIAKSLDDYFK